MVFWMCAVCIYGDTTLSHCQISAYLSGKEINCHVILHLLLIVIFSCSILRINRLTRKMLADALTIATAVTSRVSAAASQYLG